MRSVKLRSHLVMHFHFESRQIHKTYHLFTVWLGFLFSTGHSHIFPLIRVFKYQSSSVYWTYFILRVLSLCRSRSDCCDARFSLRFNTEMVLFCVQHRIWKLETEKTSKSSLNEEHGMKVRLKNSFYLILINEIKNCDLLKVQKIVNKFQNNFSIHEKPKKIYLS